MENMTESSYPLVPYSSLPFCGLSAFGDTLLAGSTKNSNGILNITIFAAKHSLSPRISAFLLQWPKNPLFCTSGGTPKNLTQSQQMATLDIIAKKAQVHWA
jgi:hypothetical protein